MRAVANIKHFFGVVNEAGIFTFVAIKDQQIYHMDFPSFEERSWKFQPGLEEELSNLFVSNQLYWEGQVFLKNILITFFFTSYFAFFSHRKFSIFDCT